MARRVRLSGLWSPMATGNPWNMLPVLSNNGDLNLDTSSVGLGRSLCLASVLGIPRVVAALDVDRYRRSLSGREIDRGPFSFPCSGRSGTYKPASEFLFFKAGLVAFLVNVFLKSIRWAWRRTPLKTANAFGVENSVLGIHEYPFRKSCWIVVVFEMGGETQMVRFTEYKIYTKQYLLGAKVERSENSVCHVSPFRYHHHGICTS